MIDKLLNKGIETHLAMSPFLKNLNQKDCDEYIKFGKLLLNKYKSKKFLIKFSGECLDNNYSITSQDKSKFYNLSKRFYNECYGESGRDFSFIDIHKQKILFEKCNFGNLTISANGEVFFCPLVNYQETNLNIRKNSISEIIKISNILKHKSNVSRMNKCSNCNLKYICGGGCRVKYLQKKLCINLFLNNQEFLSGYCGKKYKEEIYETMIRTNKFLMR